MSSVLTRPLTVALVDDYDVVLIGLAHLFDEHRDRVVVAEIDANAALHDRIDVVLYDSFAQPESDHEEVARLLASEKAPCVAVYTWNFQPELVEAAIREGARGYLSKAMTAEELVSALERIHGGEVVVSEVNGRVVSAPGLDWPGRDHGLTDRESEILALITQGRSNAEVASLTYLSPNTVKSYIRSVYRKIGVDSRTRAVLWGVKNGFAPDHHRIDHWLGGPGRTSVSRGAAACCCCSSDAPTRSGGGTPPCSMRAADSLVRGRSHSSPSPALTLPGVAADRLF